ncbi:uncharacterized protein LOC134269877 [Saccostrea cucullata]|uniref:uncharacterized protein LOC134269877 n=1 Tax=Saccostrea cuccullata TaxID=36930 RepID=UPI002ED1BC60
MLYSVLNKQHTFLSGVYEQNQDSLNGMKKLLVGIMIAISLIFFTSSSVTLASNCNNPLDFDIYQSKNFKKVGLGNITENIKWALQNTSLTEDEDQLVRDFLSIDITSVELKVVQKGPLEICAVSLSIRKCFEIRCDCQNVPGEGGLRTSNINPLCSAKEHTSSLQDRPCQENNTVETSENKTSNHYQSEGTSSKAEKSFKDQSTGFTSATFNLMQSEKGKDFSPWFTTGVFVGGFVFGLIISMTFSYLCNRRRRTGAEKEKPEYSMGQDIPLLNSHLPVKDTPVYSEISEQKQNNKASNSRSSIFLQN